VKIKRLKLTGFKTFVEPTELLIEPGLTGIVGPNGCGKSNLVEALRWVMGESVQEHARLGDGRCHLRRLERAPGPQHGRSRAHADNSDRKAPAAFNETDVLEVTRRIEREEGSTYRVNGKEVRARDVQLLFADAATGARSPALVSQGRIGAVISAKPPSAASMLEEAAGIAGLHVRRKDAEQKLRATETNLTRLDELLADMEVRAAALKRQARQAERYRQLTDQIKIAEARLIYARWRDAAAAADAARKEAEAAEAAVARAAEAHRGAAAWQTQAVQVLADKRSAALSAREKASEAGHALATLRSERAALDRRITELAAQKERMAQDREREGALANDAADALARLGDEAKTLDARVSAAEKNRPGLERRVLDAEAAARDAEVGLAKAMAAQASEQAEARVAQAALGNARARLDRAERETTRLAGERDGLGDEAPLIAARDAAVKARETAEIEARDATGAIADAERQRDEAAAARQTAESAIASAKAGLSALESEAKALLRAVDQGSGKDRLLDRMKAAPGYERALAAALGDDLDAGMSADAKRYWAGAEPQDGDPALPPGTSALADHVKAPGALARRLAQIAVVDSDDGSVLAVGQRLVTLGGVLRRWDGYVATEGGAAAAERLIRLNRLAEIEELLPEAQMVVARAGEDADAARASVEAARSAADAARAALARAEQISRNAAREEDQANGQIERLTGRRAEMVERIERAGAETREAQTEVQRAEAGVAALPDGSATTQQVAALQAVNEAARAAVAQLKAESATIDRAIATDRERLAAAQAEAKGWRARAGEAARRIEEMAKRSEAAEKESALLADAPAKLDAKIATQEEASRTLAAASETLLTEEREADAALRKSEAALAEAGEALAVVREARAGAVARAENQELRRIEMGRISGERFECPPPVLPQKVGFASEMCRRAAESARTTGWLPIASGSARSISSPNRSWPNSRPSAKKSAEREELGQAVNRLRGSIGSSTAKGACDCLPRSRRSTAISSGCSRRCSTAGRRISNWSIQRRSARGRARDHGAAAGQEARSLTLLSGGEQALTAVALIFGLFLTNPAPICVLDEVDAPLDDANIERFCDLLDRWCAKPRPVT
jgi:chromosome segregation protein